MMSFKLIAGDCIGWHYSHYVDYAWLRGLVMFLVIAVFIVF